MLQLIKIFKGAMYENNNRKFYPKAPKPLALSLITTKFQ